MVVAFWLLMASLATHRSIMADDLGSGMSLHYIPRSLFSHRGWGHIGRGGEEGESKCLCGLSNDVSSGKMGQDALLFSILSTIGPLASAVR